MKHLIAPAPDAANPTEGPRIRHIDGLRAIAVIAVVAYHAGIPGFAGGYVGVDVFFVISGFLIISQIIAELRAGHFTFAGFYARRTLRILPPYLAMMAGAFLLACLILVPPFEWEWYTLSAVFSSLFLSNFFFLSKQGYFDVGALEKPLLHTWSLSVEEQFYIAAPLLLFALFWLIRRQRLDPSVWLAIAGAAIFAVSLAGCIALTAESGRNPAFFLFLWRGWEFIAGGAVAWLASHPLLRAGPPALAEGTGIVGLALILVSVVLDPGAASFPGYAAILPVAGSALMLLAGLLDPDCRSARLLAARPMVLVGLISYGWYLWHWPLMSFAHIATFWSESPLLLTAMGLVALIPAILSYRFVEMPVRRWRRDRDLRALGWRPALAGAAAAIALALVVGGVGGAVYGLTRHGPMIAGDPALIDPPARLCAGRECAVPGRAAGFLEGDSHADRLRPILLREAQPFGVRIVPFRARCRDAGGARMPDDMGDCDLVAQRIATAQQPGEQMDFWIVERLWSYMIYARTDRDLRDEFIGKIRQRLEVYSDGGRNRLLVIGSLPDFDHSITECIYRAERHGLGWDYCAVPRAQIEKTTIASNTIMAGIVRQIPNARFVDPTGLLCDERLCRPYVGRSILFRDNNHLSPFGAAWYYAKLRPHMVWAMTGREESAGAPLP